MESKRPGQGLKLEPLPNNWLLELQHFERHRSSTELRRKTILCSSTPGSKCLLDPTLNACQNSCQLD